MSFVCLEFGFVAFFDQVYDGRLQQLKKQSLDFRFRLREHKERPKALEMLRNSLNLSRTFLVQINNITDKDEIYTSKDLEDLGKVINDTTVRCISLPQIRESDVEQGLGKVRELYFESGKIDILKESLAGLKEFNTADLLSLKGGRNIRGHCDLNDIFP